MYNHRSVLSLILILVFLIPIPLYTSAWEQPEKQLTVASGEAWLTGYTYRKMHNITGSPGAGTDYQVMIDVHYNDVFEPSLTYDISWADSAHQGVAVDGTYVYTTNSTMITKYQEDGTYLSSHDCDSDGTYNTLGDMFYYDGFLYVVAHSGGSPWHAKAMQYTTGLVYNGEFSLTDITNPTGAPNNIAYGRDSFWVVEGWGGLVETEMEIQRYDLDWAYQENWIITTLEMTSGSYGYQGFDWIDENYLIAVTHEGVEPNMVDLYHFDGITFRPSSQIVRPEWAGDDSSTYEACQGVAVEIDGDKTYVWFASRNNTAVTQAGEVARYEFSTSGDGNEVAMSGNCQTDFDDIRFTAGDGVTLLDHWRESYTASDTATFWVEVQDTLSSDATIYIYYGHDTINTASDGDATFDIFSDFSRFMDMETWEQYSSSNSYVFSDDVETVGSFSTIGKGEGLAYDGTYYYFCTYDVTTSSSWLYQFDNDLEVIESIELTDGSLTHSGGMCLYDGILYIVCAEPSDLQTYPSKVKRYHASTLTYMNTVMDSSDFGNDHWGGVFIIGTLDRMYIENWDSDEIYVFEIDGTYVTMIEDAPDTKIQDFVYIEQDGLIYGSRQTAPYNIISVWKPSADGNNLSKVGEVLTEDDRTYNGFTWYDGYFYSSGILPDDSITKMNGANLNLTIDDHYIYNDDTIGPNLMIEARLKMGGNRRFNLGFVANVPASGTTIIFHNQDGDCNIFEGNDDDDCDFDFGQNTWITLSLGWVEDHAKSYKNRGSEHTTDDGDISGAALKPYLDLWGSADAPIYCSWIFIRNWVFVEPSPSAWGELEVYSMIDEGVLWGLNVTIIFLGLIMIPASALYLVRGGREDLDSDKVFYVLIIFFIGCALFLGGIMP